MRSGKRAKLSEMEINCQSTQFQISHMSYEIFAEQQDAKTFLEFLISNVCELILEMDQSFSFPQRQYKKRCTDTNISILGSD